MEAAPTLGLGVKSVDFSVMVPGPWSFHWVCILNQFARGETQIEQ
jgi:hypothetical protein